MNATQFVVATVTAMSVVGAAGFAYAQTTSPAASAPTSDVQQPMPPSTSAPAAPMGSTSPDSSTTPGSLNAPAAGTMDGTTSSPARATVRTADETLPRDGSAMPSERAARADRN